MKPAKPPLPLCSGLFEAHVTVDPLNSAERERFSRFCSEAEVKPILIELPAGDVPVQPMTSSIHRGDYDQVFKQVQQLAARLQAAGFNVTRIKIEAAPTNSGIPRTEAQVALYPETNYFEHHLKVLLASPEERQILSGVCEIQQRGCWSLMQQNEVRSVGLGQGPLV